MSTPVSFVNKGKSLMNSKKRTGPKTEPCGTPDLTICNLEFLFFSTIHCFLLERYELTQLRYLLSNL